MQHIRRISCTIHESVGPCTEEIGTIDSIQGTSSSDYMGTAMQSI
jgi:hypothetical protein